MPGDCSSNEECRKGPTYLGNDELHPQDWMPYLLLQKLAVVEAAVMSMKMKISCLLLLQRM